MEPLGTFWSSIVTSTRSMSECSQTVSCDRLPHRIAARTVRSLRISATSVSRARWKLSAIAASAICFKSYKLQVASSKSEVRSPKSEVRSAKCEVRSAKCEVRSAKCEVAKCERSPKSERGGKSGAPTPRQGSMPGCSNRFRARLAPLFGCSRYLSSDVGPAARRRPHLHLRQRRNQRRRPPWMWSSSARPTRAIGWPRAR